MNRAPLLLASIIGLLVAVLVFVLCQRHINRSAETEARRHRSAKLQAIHRLRTLDA